MKERGFYIVKDIFFKEMNDPYLKGNKQANRPHYYCLKDEDKDYYWMIPLSSRVDKYKKIIDRRNAIGKSCDILHIVKLDNDKESVFLIQDMFPITEQYIERPYTIAKNHLTITSEHSAMEIQNKAKKVIKLLKRGIKFIPTQANINKIINKLDNH